MIDFSFFNIYTIKITYEYLINLSVALLIFMAFLLLRRVFTRYLIRVFRNLTRKTKTELDAQLVNAFEKPLMTFFLILGIFLALWYLPLSSEFKSLISNIFRSLLIILIAWGFYSFSDSIAVLHEEIQTFFNVKIDKILVPFLSKVLKFIIVVLTITVIAQEWDYDINGFIAGLGLGGLAFALAAKDTAANIFGGIVIITDKPFSIGDWIATAKVEGIVEDINFRSTRIRTFAHSLVTIPNAELASDTITNWSRMGKRRITFNLGVTYDTPIEKLRKVVNEIRFMLQNHPDIHQETLFVNFDSFNESSLDIFLYFFTRTTNWGEFLQVKEDVNFKIMEILEKEGVSVAFPSRSVYLETPLKLEGH